MEVGFNIVLCGKILGYYSLGVVFFIEYIPQIYEVYQSKTCGSLSIAMLIMQVIGNACWVAYLWKNSGAHFIEPMHYTPLASVPQRAANEPDKLDAQKTEWVRANSQTIAAVLQAGRNNICNPPQSRVLPWKYELADLARLLTYTRGRERGGGQTRRRDRSILRGAAIGVVSPRLVRDSDHGARPELSLSR